MTQLSASKRPHLILVYNADTGLIEALMHAVHKQLWPETYPCSLCALTYGAVSMRGDWKRFWRGLDADVSFFHRDDFTHSFPALGTGGAREVALPSILISEGGLAPRVLIPCDDLDAMADVDALMEAVSAKLSPLAATDAAIPSAA